jgi:excinuclease ABC subunit C
MDKEKLKDIPDLPGVYIMKNRYGHVLYIGKAASLKKRVSSYFKRNSNLSGRIKLMVEKSSDIFFITTSSEAEALIAESAFIKRYKPRYNIALKDDKSYPYLKLTVNEEYPRLILTRKAKKVLDAKGEYYGPYTDVKLLRKALAIMKRIFPLRECRRMPKKVCLNYHIGQCYGLCIKAIDKETYHEIVKELKLFLEGQRAKLIDELSQKMKVVVEKKDYEKAAILRDRIRALSVVPRKMSEVNHRGTVPEGIAYLEKSAKPYDEIIALKYLLGLKRVPRKIEAFDISDISGKEAVGSMIIFIDGRPSKGDYRKFKIRDVKGIDDYKMMEEIIRRRYERVKSEKLPCPDLIIIDGGKGQLNIASSALQELGFERIPVIGIAKRFEHIYLKRRKEPVIFSQHSPVLHLIQRLRDEAHRFAVSYHRKLRSKKLSESILDDVEGIGKKRKKLLLNKFGSTEDIKRASLEELCSLKGIDLKTAKRIKGLTA